MTPEFTTDERALLRRVPQCIGHCIASPEHGIQDLRDSHRAGAGGGFWYDCTRTAIEGKWFEWIPVAWAGPGDIRPTGEPIEFRRGALLREARVSYRRLQQWCEALPADVRAQARTWWRTYPECTRNIPALIQLTLAAIDGPQPDLALFELQEHTHA